VRLSLTRDEFDDLVNTFVAGSAFVAFAATAYLSYWFVFVAPDLPAQLSQLRAEAALQAPPPTPGAPGVDVFGALSSMLQPSLFR
jgi:hypothetical protein